VAIAALVLASLTWMTSTSVSAAEPDDLPVASIGRATIGEGDSGPNRILRVPVTLSKPATTEVAVTVTLGPGTAIPGEDYVGWNGKHRTVRFKPNVRTGLTPTIKYVTIRVIPDAVVDDSSKFVSIYVVDAVGATIGEAEGIGTILDIEFGIEPLNGIDSGEVYVDEGDEGPRKVKIPISLDRPVTTTTTVQVHLDEYGLTSGVDYAPLSDSGTRIVTFTPGQAQAFLTITVLPNDEIKDPMAGMSARVRVAAPAGFWAWHESYLRVVDDEKLTYPAAPLAPIASIGNACTYVGPGGPLAGRLVGLSWSAPAEGEPDNYQGFANISMPKRVTPTSTSTDIGFAFGGVHAFPPTCFPSGSRAELFVRGSSIYRGPLASVTVDVP